MKAIILAGGAGTRLNSLVKDVPKPMAAVGAIPFLEYLVFQSVRWNVETITLSVGYKKEIIKSYFGAGERWGSLISYADEDEPLGTAGALKNAIKDLHDENYIVMNGDSFLGIDFKQLAAYHRNKGSRITMGLAYIEDVRRYGKVEIDAEGRVVRFAEKGGEGAGLINGGVYVVNHEIIANIPEGKVSLETEVLPQLIGAGLYGMRTDSFFVDIGIPEDYLNLCTQHEELRTLSGVRNE